MEKMHVTVPAIAIKQLVDKLGSQRAAVELGVASSAVNKWVRSGECRKVNELAASALLASHCAPEKPELLLVRVPKDKLDMTLAFFKGAEIRHARFTD